MPDTTSKRFTAPGAMTSTYTAPAPRELPELRADLASWLTTTGPSFYLTMALIGRQWLPPGELPEQASARVAAEERGRLDGDLYWVSSEMTDLARHAAPSLPTWNLYEHDIPCRRGLIVFESPLAVYRNDLGRDVQIVAATWGPWKGPGNWRREGGLWLSFYSHPAPVLPPGSFDSHGTLRPEWGPYARELPPLMPDNEAGWPFGELDIRPPTVEGTTGGWALILRAAWRLMRQPLTQTTTEQAYRAARRRLAKAGHTSPGVRVIHVRRHEHSRDRDAQASGSRDYNCRWWVNGHWRTYWCGPGRRRPEDRWISPYLAGPDDKPVHGTERVKVWDR